MLIKNTYDVMGGHLYNLFVMGLKAIDTSYNSPQEQNNFVSTKNGSKVGTSTFAQISNPFSETALYFAGFDAIIMARIKSRIGIKIS